MAANRRRSLLPRSPQPPKGAPASNSEPDCPTHSPRRKGDILRQHSHPPKRPKTQGTPRTALAVLGPRPHLCTRPSSALICPSAAGFLQPSQTFPPSQCLSTETPSHGFRRAWAPTVFARRQRLPARSHPRRGFTGLPPFQAPEGARNANPKGWPPTFLRL